VQSKAEVLDRVNIELSVGGSAVIILHQQHEFSSRKIGIFKLNSPAYRYIRPSAVFLPVLNIYRRHRPESALQPAPRTAEFPPDLCIPRIRLRWTALKKIPASPINTEALGEILGKKGVNAVIAQTLTFHMVFPKQIFIAQM